MVILEIHTLTASCRAKDPQTRQCVFPPKKHKMLSEVIKISKPRRLTIVATLSSAKKLNLNWIERFSNNVTVSLAPRQVYISRVGGEVNHQTRTGRVSKQEILVSNDSTSVKLILMAKINQAGKTFNELPFNIKIIEQYKQFTTKCSAYYFDKAIARILSEKVI